MRSLNNITENNVRVYSPNNPPSTQIIRTTVVTVSDATVPASNGGTSQVINVANNYIYAMPFASPATDIQGLIITLPSNIATNLYGKSIQTLRLGGEANQNSLAKILFDAGYVVNFQTGVGHNSKTITAKGKLTISNDNSSPYNITGVCAAHRTQQIPTLDVYELCVVAPSNPSEPIVSEEKRGQILYTLPTDINVGYSTETAEKDILVYVP